MIDLELFLKLAKRHNNPPKASVTYNSTCSFRSIGKWEHSKRYSIELGYSIYFINENDYNNLLKEGLIK